MKNKSIAVIGMGYVGLPLACAFGEFYKTIGYDINSSRIQQLNKTSLAKQGPHLGKVFLQNQQHCQTIQLWFWIQKFFGRRDERNFL